MNDQKEKRKRAPVFATVRRAFVIMARSGQTKALLFTVLWVLLGSVTSFAAVFQAQFLNSAAGIMEGREGMLSAALLWLAVWGGVEAVLTVASFFYGRVNGRMWEMVGFYLDKTVLQKLCTIRMKYFDHRDTHKKIGFVRDGLRWQMTSVIQSVTSTVRCAIQFVTALFIVVHTNWIIALLVFATAVPAILLQRRRTEESYEMNQWNSFEGQMQRYLALILIKRKYIKEMRFYQLYDYMEDKYDRSVKNMYRQQMALTKKYFGYSLAVNVLLYGAIAVSLAMISGDILKGAAQIGAFILVYNSVRNMQSALTGVFSGLNDIGDRGRYLEDYETLMGYEDEPDGNILAENRSGGEIDGRNGALSRQEDVEIAFEHVSFSYPGTDREVLKDISLTIRPGEKIAIVGENGSGKSTFVSLLTGLYEPTEGRILVNGRDIKEMLPCLREKMSCTMQDFLCYMATVEDNVRIGDLQKPHTKDDVAKALEKAGVDKDVARLPRGTDTYLGNLYEGSVDLSGGQWQKLAMARNLLKEDARIMLMDEPTAALDPMAESRLYEEFSRLTGDRTVLLISHRLGATRLADRVLVFDDGRIAEDGSHEALLEKGGLYRQMYEAQAQWYVL